MTTGRLSDNSERARIAKLPTPQSPPRRGPRQAATTGGGRVSELRGMATKIPQFCMGRRASIWHRALAFRMLMNPQQERAA